MKKFLSIIALLMAFAATGFADTWTVAGDGDESIFSQPWTPSDATNDMTEVNGVYYLVKNVTLIAEESIAFKVVKDHEWGVQYPSENYGLLIPAGTWDVLFVYDPTNNDVYAKYISNVQLLGSWNEWNQSSTPMTFSAVDFAWTETVDLSNKTEDQAFKLFINGSEWEGENVILDDPDGLVEKQTSGDRNLYLKNSTAGYKKYKMTATWAGVWTLKIEGQEPRMAEITSVVFSYGVAGADWSNLDLVKGDDGKYTATLDLSEVLSNQDFKLNINNGTWLGTNQLTLDAGNLVTVPDGIGDGQNFTLLNATSGFKTYTITAEWTEGNDAAAGWTLAIAGAQERTKYTYTATFVNTKKWADVYAYAWKDNGEVVKLNGDFPGEKLTETGTKYIKPFNYDVYTFTYSSYVEGAPDFIIFSDGTDANKTGDLAFAETEFTGGDVTPFPGTEIWESETPVTASWYSDPYDLIISKDKLANVKVGDIIHVAVVGIADGLVNEWDAQVKLKDGWWADAEASVNVGLGNVTDASFVVTGDMLTHFKERGFIVSGYNYSTTLVTVEATTVTGSDKSIWVGNNTTAAPVTVKQEHFQTANDWVYVGPNSWDYAFEGVKAGDIIRINANKVSDGAWLIIRYSGDASNNWAWQEFTDAEITNTAVGFEVVVGESMVEWLKSRDFIVHFSGYALSQIELISPKVTGYYAITSDGGSWTVGDEMTEESGVYSATVQGSTSKYFAIAPNTAITTEATGVANWAKVIRPVTTSGNFVVNFVNYSDKTMTGGENVWEVGSTNDAAITISYNPAAAEGDNNYEISCETEVNIGSTGYATYSNDQKYKVEDATANFITVSGKKASLVPQDADAVLPAKTGAGKNAGIILSGSANTKAKIKSVGNDEAVDASENLLAGTGDDTNYIITGKFSDTETYAPYIFADGYNGVGFYALDTSADDNRKIAAHKAFLAAPVTSDAPSFFSFDDTTGIDAIENAQLTNGSVYNLNGQRVAQPTKGLYIVNGKKVIVK